MTSLDPEREADRPAWRAGRDAPHREATPPVLWTAADWARAIAGLPAAGPLPVRTALVPGEAVAHTLRRALIREGLEHALAGTRFLGSGVAALEVLRGAGVDVVAGEENLRPARLLALFREGLSLEHFPLDLLRGTPGWDEAFARTIGALEGAGLSPADLEAHAADRLAGAAGAGGAAARLRDVAVIWRALDEAAGPSWTTPRLHAEAAFRLERAPALWPHDGAVLAAATGHETAAHARFVRAIPGVALAIVGARPARDHHVARLGALFGAPAAAALTGAAAPRAHASERDLLAAYFLEPPALLADPARPRSRGPEGTVDLEEHAALDEEIEASADWVARQVLAGIPLEEIAVLMPAPDPVVQLLADRLARLPWPTGPLPVHVVGGLPLVGLPAGARVLAVVRGLRAHLSGEALAEVLPSLRTVGEADRHVAHGPAMELVWSLGTAGGSPARPEGALDWSARLAVREPALAAQLDLARATEEDPERPASARRARDIERTLGNLRSVRPAVDALVNVAHLVAAQAPLAALWPSLRDFLDTWLLQPGEGPRVAALLDERLAGTAADPRCGALPADDALRLVEEAILALRVPAGRFGEPAVTLAAVGQAAGLEFRAVRVIGLSEGHLPSVPREDPVLPDALRGDLQPRGAGWPPLGPPAPADRALAELHALDRVIRGASERVALSMARFDVERSQREPSSVFLEAGAALARPNAATGDRGRDIPDSRALRRDAFAPARAAARCFRLMTPLGEAAWQDAVAAGAVDLPPHWRSGSALDLERIRTLGKAEAAGPADGLLGELVAGLAMPGIDPERPISPSGLELLLGCPHRFMLERLLGFPEPAKAPGKRGIDARSWGSLFHAAAEAVYREHGAAICAGKGAREEWLARADHIADRIFGEFLEQYPLVGDGVQAAHRDRLRADVRELIGADWSARHFVAVEQTFGQPDPVRLELGERALFLRGRIDRIDVDSGRTLVRDLKTGRACPRFGKQAEPGHRLDVQIGTYGLVAHALAGAWGTPGPIGAAYAYFGRRGSGEERDFRKDFDSTLGPAALAWLGVAAGLLEARAFPRTPELADCDYCAFRPVCGPGAPARAAEVLADATGALGDFRALKATLPRTTGGQTATLNPATSKGERVLAVPSPPPVAPGARGRVRGQ